MNVFSILFLLFASFNLISRENIKSPELQQLYKEFDRDHDQKITVDDKIPTTAVFKINRPDPIKVMGTYQISNLAQELRLWETSGKELNKEHIFENPVERISRLIKDLYWDGLTRRIDARTVLEVIEDPKIDSSKKILYVPSSDESALKYYKKNLPKEIQTQVLPKKIEKGFIAKLGKDQGLLALALKDGTGVPYVVPGGRFNEMYGWDSYFHVLGVIHDKRPELAKAMVDNFIYEITHYGKILNANRSYYLTRSQPPFFTSMIKEVLTTMSDDKERVEWLKTALTAALKEYDTIWMGKDRLTFTGLSRYAGFDEGIPPEVEPGHFDQILEEAAKRHNKSREEVINLFNSGELKDSKLIEFFHQDRAVRESGHDTTYRWRVGSEDRASDFVTVDLNSLLYKYELDLFYFIDKFFSGRFVKRKSSEFKIAAVKRRKLIRSLLWNPEKHLFFDYNFKLHKKSDYISATTFYPLWASSGYPDEFKILDGVEAANLVKSALLHLEENGGLAASAKKSLQSVLDRKEERQWDYPNGWAPHQIIAWKGLENYGHLREMKQLTYKWLFMITKNARDYNGTIPEKFDVVKRSHKVFAEYGNVGTTFSYITTEGFGWMNASFQLGLDNLSKAELTKLKTLVPPEDVNF